MHRPGTARSPARSRTGPAPGAASSSAPPARVRSDHRDRGPDLRDDDFALRPWRGRDLPGLLEGFLDPVVQRFSWPGVEAYTEADGRAFIADRTKWLAEGTCADVAIVESADEDAILGGASIYDIETAWRRASTGYWLAPRARGRGIATRAVRLLARWAFDDLGIERLQLTCGPDNLAPNVSPSGPGSRARVSCARSCRSRVSAETRLCSASCQPSFADSWRRFPAICEMCIPQNFDSSRGTFIPRLETGKRIRPMTDALAALQNTEAPTQETGPLTALGGRDRRRALQHGAARARPLPRHRRRRRGGPVRARGSGGPGLRIGRSPACDILLDDARYRAATR